MDSNAGIMRQSLLIVFVVTGCLLLTPLIAMQFTDSVQWNLADYMIAGALLFGTGILISIVVLKVKSKRYRILAVSILILLLLVIWAELAVGIFGTPLSGS